MKSWIQTRLLRLYMLLLYSEDQKKKKTHLTYFSCASTDTFGVLFNPTNFSLSVDYFC